MSSSARIGHGIHKSPERKRRDLLSGCARSPGLRRGLLLGGGVPMPDPPACAGGFYWGRGADARSPGLRRGFLLGARTTDAP